VRLTYRVPEESYSRISEKLIREALAPAYWIAGIRVEVLRNRETRSRVLTESLDPRTALATYLETSGATAQRREELMAYAAPLFEELAREEEVRP
jgi:L-2-hydroxyglutarate oxidase LhgO